MLNWDCSKWKQRRSSYLLQWIKLFFFRLFYKILRGKKWVLKQFFFKTTPQNIKDHKMGFKTVEFMRKAS